MVNSTTQPLVHQSFQARITPLIKYILACGVIFVVICLLVYLELAQAPLRQYFRFLTILPVFYVAYQFGVFSGLATSLLFSSAFVPLLYYTTRENIFSPQAIEVATSILIVNTFGLLIADVARSIRSRQAIARENAHLFQEIEAQQKRANLIIHSIEDGLLTVNTDGEILTFNPAAERLTGWTAQEAIGRQCCEIFGCIHETDQKQKECSLFLTLSQSYSAYESKFVIRQRTGTKRVISFSLAPLPVSSGEAACSVFLFRDITEQEDMDRLQKELIAAISHELRAPLSHINSITETLEEAEEPAVQSYSQYFHNLRKQTKRLIDFSDRIMDVYRLENGKLDLQLRPLPISLLVEGTIKHWQGDALLHRFNLNLPGKSPWIWADENAFQTVFINLLDNAVKYSLPNTPIDILIKESSPGYVTCEIRDYGPGIAAEYQTKIFERFYRLNGGDSQSVYGPGIGLYIAKSLVQAMNGQIWVQSEIGHGSVFAFSLPIMEESNAG